MVWLLLILDFELYHQVNLVWSYIAKTYRDSIVTIASELVDRPSVKYTPDHPELGQSPTNGFDCSGFVRYVLHEAGLTIPEYIGQDGAERPIRHANEFWDNYGITVHDACKQPGDLLFFSRRGSFPTHIGIVRDEDTYIHAPGISESKIEVQPIQYETIAVQGIGRQLLYEKSNRL